MPWLLVFVSGIPPLEAHMVRARDARWEAYRARTGNTVLFSTWK